MSGSVNKVILVGNLGKDPEIRHTQDGKAIANLSLATTESWKDKSSGERKEKTEWHKIVCFNDNISKVIEQYLKKGSSVYIEGQLQTRKWTDKDGAEKYSTEIVLQAFNGTLTMLGGKPESENERPVRQSATQASAIRDEFVRDEKHEQRGYLSDEVPF